MIIFETLPTTWLEFATILGNGAISGAGGFIAVEFIKEVFNLNVDYEGLIKDAVDNICFFVKEQVDNICFFVKEQIENIENTQLNEYLKDCNYVKDQLQIYGGTSNREVIFLTQDHVSKLVRRIQGFGAKGFGGLMLACNLHLLSLRALSEIPGEEEFKGELEIFSKKYADILDKGSKEYIGKISKVVGDCDYIPDLSTFPGPMEWYYTYYVDSIPVYSDSKIQCEERKKKSDKELVEPAMEIYNHSQEVIEGYKEFKIENL